MILVPIFTDNNSFEGIYSIKYNSVSDTDEFSRIMNLWNDTEYLMRYFEDNEVYINSSYFEDYTLDDLIDKVQFEANRLEEFMYELTEGGFKENGQNLQQLFRPLDDMECSLVLYQPSKASFSDRSNRKPILRIYALRISSNTFVITGGAIKLTKRMSEHDDTSKELQKLKWVKAFLVYSEIISAEDLKFII